VLRTSCLRQRLTAQRAQEILGHLGALPIDVDRAAVPPRELLALALRFGLSSYDAAYLELALRRQLPVATQDEGLRAAAVAAGVGLV
jgi:predicted nucleic acid-binding protein